MFTVLIIDSCGTYQQFEAYRFLFQSYIASGQMGVCVWDTSGDVMANALPKLGAMVREHDAWRAIVINPDAFNDDHLEVLESQNPFDYSRVDGEDGPHESPIPLVRLSHILGGYPSAPPKVFEEVYECYEHAEDGDDVSLEEQENRQMLRIEEVTDEDRDRYTLKSVYIPKVNRRDVLAKYRALSKKYISSVSKPCEILLFGVRRYVPLEEHRVRDAWLMPTESLSSTFWQRNKYPDNCRFLFSSEHQGVRHGFEFWLSVLTLVLNRVPSATLQAYRLYRADIEIVEDKLAQAMNVHMDKLDALSAYFIEKRDAVPEYTLSSARMVLERQDIRVLSEVTDEKYDPKNALNQGKEDIDAHGAFQTDRTDMVETALELVDPRRAIERAAHDLRAKAGSFWGERISLDEFQYGDLMKESAELEKQVFRNRPRNTFDAEGVHKALLHYREKDDNMPKQPLTTAQQLTLTCMALVVALCGFVPYFWELYRSGAVQETWWRALGLCLGVLMVTALGGYVALIPFKKKVSEQLLENKGIVQKEKEKICEIEKAFSHHFSDICTYMKAQALLMGTEIGQNENQRLKGIWQKNLEYTKNVIDRILEIMSEFRVTREANDYPAFDGSCLPVGADIKDHVIFGLDMPPEVLKMPLNRAGYCIYAPYEFVSRFVIEREEIFDDLDEESLS